MTACARRKALDDSLDMQIGEGLVGVDEQIAVRLEAREHVDRLEQGRVLDDQAVRLEDRLAQPDLLVGDAAEGDDRRADALGAETRERLGVAAFEKGGDRQHFRAVTTPWPPRP